MFQFRRAALASLAAIILVIAARPSAASAHANLARSEPAAGAVLEKAPDQVTMTFTEEPELRASEARVLRADGSVALPEAKLALADPVTLRFALPPFEEGTYTIVWRVVSAVDGHPTAGAIPFSIGQAGPTPVLPAAALSDAGGPPRGLLAAGKLLSYTAFSLLLLIGIILPAIVLPAAAASASARLLPKMARLVRTGAILTLILLAGSAALALFLQAWANGGEVRSVAGDTTWTLLRSTRFGTTWLIRATVSLAAAILLIVVAQRSRSLLGAGAGRTSRFLFWPLALAGMALPLTLSWNSHFAAADTRAHLGALGDGAHAIAAALWLGGLVALAGLAIVSRPRAGEAGEDQALHIAVRRFSIPAAAAVAVLLLSGIVAWWRVDGNAGDIFATGYGRILLVKIALLTMMLALAALHFFHGHLPGVASRLGASSTRIIRRTVVLEAVLGVCVIAAAGLLSTTPPPESGGRDPAAPSAGVLSERAGNITIRLRATPLLAGQNLLTFELSGKGAADVQRLIVRLNYLDDEIGISQVDAPSEGAQRFVIRGSQLSLPGRWEVTAIVRRQDQPEARATFHVMVGRP